MKKKYDILLIGHIGMAHMTATLARLQHSMPDINIEVVELDNAADHMAQMKKIQELGMPEPLKLTAPPPMMPQITLTNSSFDTDNQRKRYNRKKQYGKRR